MKLDFSNLKLSYLLAIFLMSSFYATAINFDDYRLTYNKESNNEEEMSSPFNFTGWNRKQAITINSSMVDGTVDLINFPFLVTLDHLDSEIVDGGANSAENGGGDLRFSSDAAGNNPLAIEVVQFVTSATPSNRSCQIWVKIPNLSTNSDTTIYVWYNKSGEVQPSPTDTYGSQAVWTNYDFVSHDIKTESSNGHLITKNTEAGMAPGPFGTDVSDFDGVNDYHTFDNLGMGLHTSRTVSSWVSFDDNNSEWQRIFQSSGLSGDGDAHGFQIIKRYDYLYFGADNKSGGVIDQTEAIQTGSYSTGSWVRVTGDWTTLGTKGTMKVNNTAESGASDTQLYSANNRTARFGNRNTNNNWFDGRIANFTISKQKLSDAYVSTEYNNQSNSASFATAGTPQDASSGGTGGSGSDSYWTETSNDIYFNNLNGNVGIGTLPQTNYRLAVDGSIHTKEVRVDMIDWPDYVFSADYNLPSLMEVEKYILKNGHLMNVPSANDVDIYGVELGKMNKVLLEKIEELTLYILQQDKKQKKLELEISELEQQRK